MIIGQPGSGKSTLARELGGITHLPVVHIDHIHWQSGWIERSRAEKSVMCHDVHMREHWIFEGGHSATWAERLERADMLIWLDFPLPIRMWRVVKRTVRHFGRDQPDLPDGCPEQFRWEFFRWIWNTRKTGRTLARKLFESASDEKALHHLKTPKDVDGFLSALRTATAVGNLGVSHR